jgi:LCP family protein required for cell wall assembly
VIRRAVVALVLAAGLLLLPGPTHHPASVSLVRLESASAVDLGDGVVWILAVGSDADPGQDLMSGNADAIQMVGLDVDARRAVAIGIPRDSWVDVNGSKARINTGLRAKGGGPELMAELVEDLLGIAPQYVAVSGPEMFADMVDAIGELTVRSPVAFEDEESGLVVKRGLNEFDGEEAAAFAGSRDLPGYDFSRSANQQRLLESILAEVRAREDQTGFLETGALAALEGLETDLDPVEIYRFANAIAEIEPSRVTTCVIGGEPFTTGANAAVIRPDRPQARRVARDARPDAELDRGCR